MDELALTIDRLNMTFAEASGHEHRVRAISARAAALLQELVGQRLLAAGIDLGSRRIDHLAAGPVELDLGLASDEEAARRVAVAVCEVLVLRFRLGG
jgi:predicted dinucleotide-binding enzyme